MAGRNARITGTTPLWSAARILLGRRNEEFFSHLRQALAARGHEEIHDLRVASRRLREAVRTFEGCYNSSTMNRIDRAARRVTRLLGGLRNIDEAVIFFTKLMEESDDESRQHLDRFIVTSGRLREKELRSLGWRLERISTGGRREKFTKMIGAPRLLTMPAGVCDPLMPLRDFVKGVMDGRIENVLGLVNAALGETNVDDQHRLRIAVKHFRYRVELFSALMRKKQEKIIEALKGYQTVLGSLHDMDVFRDMVNEAVFPRNVEEKLFVLITVKRKEYFDCFVKMHHERPLSSICSEVKNATGK